jgi:cell division protein FtsI/penicillin-binding protein 2
MKNNTYHSDKNIPVLNLLKFLTLFLLIIFIYSVNTNNQSSSQKITNILNSTNIIQAQRGNILDTNGIILAKDVELNDLYINENKSTLGSCEKYIYQGAKFCIAKKALDHAALSEYIQTNNLLDTEYITKSYFKRVYPFGELTYHLVGYLQSDGLQRRSSFGVEKYYDSNLKGQDGYVEGYLDSEYTIQAIRGQDVVISININWQRKLADLLLKYKQLVNASTISGVILDNTNGEFVSYISLPAIDPDKLFLGNDQILQDLRGHVYLDKNLSVYSSPGSIFKIISSYYLLDEGIITPFSVVNSQGCIIFPDSSRFCEFNENKYGILNLRSALARSSNIFFCQSALASNNKNIQEKMFEIAKIFNIASGNSINGFLDIEPKLNINNKFAGDVCNFLIGQGDVSMSTLNVLNAYTFLGSSRGSWKYSKFSKTLVSDNNADISIDYLDNLANNDNLKLIQSGLKDAVYNSIGTTYSTLGNLKEFKLIVKTGTAESHEFINGVLRNTTHGWIGGIFYFEGKEYAFVLNSRHGGNGFGLSYVLKDFLTCLSKEVC